MFFIQIQKLYKESAKTGRLDTAVCLPAVVIETGSVTRRQDDVHVTNVLMGSGERAVNQVCTKCAVVLRLFNCFLCLVYHIREDCFGLSVSLVSLWPYRLNQTKYKNNTYFLKKIKGQGQLRIMFIDRSQGFTLWDFCHCLARSNITH